MGPTRTEAALRRTALAAAALAALATTSGCTVAVHAVAGISVDQDGHLLGVLMVCSKRIDVVSLEYDDGHRMATVGRWAADPARGPGPAVWTLDAPAEGWTAETPMAPLVAGTTYRLRGGTRDDSSAASSVSFTTADRERLTPGNVRYERGSDVLTVPVAEFEAAACRTD
ncbi:hypothetical protein [Kitasatospora sp. NPDC088134]|uniref:hypothetical protein n=1 Tax=Kitasatospora sp. NPDC088134 TaxID=3364071 RepID=UPI0037FFAE0B